MKLSEAFPKWKELKPGEWCKPSFDPFIGKLEIGLYREPLDCGEYSGTYTLHIFDGDDVPYCRMVDIKELEE